MNRKDIILSAVLLAVAVILLYAAHNGEGATASVYVNGSLYGTYDLSVPCDIHLENNGIINDIAISDGGIYVKDATCPGKQCVKTGKIHLNNESICCAPAGVLIVVHSDTGSELDAITK